MSDVDPFVWLFSIPLFLAIVWPRIAQFYKTWISVAIREHATREYPLTPEWEETNADQLTPEQREFLGRAVLDFRASGFDVMANLRRKTESDSGKIKLNQCLILLVDSRTGDRASITTLAGKHIRILTLRVFSEFCDGRLIVTDNRNHGVLPIDPKIDSATFAWVADPRTLAEVHRRRIALAGRADQARKPPPPGPVFEELNESWRRDFDWFVRIGYYRLDQARNRLRPTWRGAFLGQWRVKPIIKNRLLRRRDAKARRLWVELGMDQWTTPSAAGPRAESFAASTLLEPGIDSSSVEESSASLGYQSELASGQIRRERRDGALTVRVMLSDWKQILERNVPLILLAAFFAFLAGCDIYRIWSTRRAVARMFWAFSRRARGTTLISVSHDGLRISNAPGRMRNGYFSRTEIETMLVVMDQAGLTRPIFRLQAHLSGGRKPVILLVGPDPQRLGNIRRELLVAMGIV